MTFEDRLEISTSEGIDVELTIAGIGSRTLAWLLDGVVIGAILLAVGVGGAIMSDFDSLLAQGLVSLAVLALPSAYLVGFETLNGGRTPGKMSAGIKTVKVSGAPVGFGSALVRTLILPFDIAFLGIGIVSMIVTERSQRLGDLAARTVVVRDRKPPMAYTGSSFQPPVDADTSTWDVSAITEAELGAIRRFLERAATLEPGHRADLARQLNERVRPRVAGVERSYGPEEFLARLVVEKDRRIE